MRTPRLPLIVAALLCAGFARAAGDMQLAPPWEQAPATAFTTGEGAALADGRPLPLMMDFTWSAPEGEEMVRFQSQFLGTAHYRNIPLSYDGKWDWSRVDRIYDWAAKHRLYIVLGLNVQQGVPYVRQDPTVSARTADGKPVESNVSFMHEGYRQVLHRALTELAEHVRSKPYHLGYYPQDEFAYRALSGYEPCSVAAFRTWVVQKHGGLAEVNAAWKTQYREAGEIEPPAAKEPTLAWADWQEFRRFAQMDFTREVYETLKQADPNHLVIWSLPFMGWEGDAASWWRFAPVSDVLMRHGIGYSTGLFRLKMLSALASWSGKPANALCMPPEYDPSFVQMMILMDGPQSGLSHVCTAGTVENGTYMGSADPRDGWRRREPLYTRSRSLNDLVRQLGPTLLASRPRPPQVGVYVSDRQVLLEGLNLNSLNGVLQLLGDLNLDTEVFSELSWSRLQQYPAVVLGSFSRCADAKMVADLKAYVQAGGTLLAAPGALEEDENGLRVDRGWAPLGGGGALGTTEAKEPLRIVAGPLTGALQSLPVLGPASYRAAGPDVTVLAGTPGRGAAVTLTAVGQGQVLWFGTDYGLPYQAGFTEDFAGVVRRPDKQVLDEQAGFHFEPTRGAEQALGLQAHKAWAELLRACLAARGLAPRVRVQPGGDAIGAIKALSFRGGSDYWVGLANRVVRRGKDFHRTPPAELHEVLRNVQVTVAPEADAVPRYAVVMPDGRQSGEGFRAVPEILRVKGNTFAVAELADYRLALLTAGHDPVLGLEVTPARAVRGQKVKLTAHAVNPSDRAVRLALVVDGSPGLETGQKLTLSCPTGGTASASCEVAVGERAPAGYETLQLVADLGGRRLLSPSAEIEVAPDVDLQVAGADRTLFPAEEPARLTVTATNNRPQAGTLTAELKLPAGYTATPASLRLALPPRQQVQASLLVQPGAAAPAVAEGELRAVTQSGGTREELRRPLRLARGVVAYTETRPVRLAAAEESRRPVPLACLENRYLRAEFIPVSGTLHSLIPRFAGRDFLLEGDYPIGLVWYGLGGGFTQSELTADDREARLVLTGGPGGKVTLTATLGRDARELRCVWDAHDLGPQPQTFYLMSHVTAGGRPDVLAAATRQGPLAVARGQRVLAAADLGEHWTAVQSEDGAQSLGVAFDFPALQSLTLRQGGGSPNYTLFAPGEAPPGKITFWLSGIEGNAEAVGKWAAGLARR